jgi:hypothetical protein
MAPSSFATAPASCRTCRLQWASVPASSTQSTEPPLRWLQPQHGLLAFHELGELGRRERVHGLHDLLLAEATVGHRHATDHGRVQARPGDVCHPSRRTARPRLISVELVKPKPGATAQSLSRPGGLGFPPSVWRRRRHASAVSTRSLCRALRQPRPPALGLGNTRTSLVECVQTLLLGDALLGERRRRTDGRKKAKGCAEGECYVSMRHEFTPLVSVVGVHLAAATRIPVASEAARGLYHASAGACTGFHRKTGIPGCNVSLRPTRFLSGRVLLTSIAPRMSAPSGDLEDIGVLRAVMPSRDFTIR